jgi:hypothetical protein
LELLGVGELEVHVAVRAHQEALVLHAPLQPNQHWLARLQLQERFWVDWLELSRTRKKEPSGSHPIHVAFETEDLHSTCYRR